jgi:hypothetical protein
MLITKTPALVPSKRQLLNDASIILYAIMIRWVIKWLGRTALRFFGHSCILRLLAASSHRWIMTIIGIDLGTSNFVFLRALEHAGNQRNGPG